jgi:hypothetical protein
MAYSTVWGLLGSVVLAAGAQTLHVRGKVTDAAQKPLANVTVELLRAKLKVTTGADGQYVLGTGTGIGRGFAETAEMRLERGMLELRVGKATRLRIEIFDVKGNLLDRTVLDRAASGDYRLDLAGKARGRFLHLVKASLGRQSRVFPFFPMGRKDAAYAGLEYLGLPGTPLARTGPYVDTLKATATGYQTKTFALNSQDMAQDILLEAVASCTAPAPPTAVDAVTLDMSVAEGAPNYLASGFIYGISQDGTQPPNALLSDIKVNRFRAGRGTSGGCGEAAWKTHWNVMKAYYAKAKALGGTMLLLVSDNYQYSCPLPGEGGDWTTFDAFLAQFIDSVKANAMTGPDVRWELWNEGDLSPTFWTGTQAQWLAMWKHAYQQVRAALPSAVIEGPSFASGASGSWMNAFLDYAKANDVVPDILSWHIAGGGGDPANDVATLTRALATRGITGVKGFDLNEYGSRTEQNPGHSAWFLARFDRTGIEGMRSNWAGGSTFFSNLGDLVTTSWQPNSQYWIYKRYAEQTGLRIKTTAGTRVDAVGYQDMAAAKSILIVGNRGGSGSTGAINVVIRNVPSWLQAGGATRVRLERMPTGTGASAGPTVVSNASAPVTCNTLIVTLDWAVATDGYVLTLTPN